LGILCGIAGFTHRKSVANPERIRSAVDCLIHRGPDQQGVFETGVISLGAARLKIIDLHGGDQPIVSEDAAHVIAFNGEIYNHLEVRRELESRGHRFRSQSDTETMLRAFIEWDTECFARLRGMFAVALWSEKDKRLVLARDRTGIKPLYIARRGDDIYFGSELKAIFVHPEIERRISLAGLDCYLSLNYVPYPWTLVEGIEKLEPGRWLEWRDGAVRSERYWMLPYGPVPGVTLEDGKRVLDSLLQQSVSEHLLSDVPLGVWLSGGIDSSTILHYAATANRGRLKTFSISFGGHSFDETEYIRLAAGQYATDHQEFDLNPEAGLQDAIEEFAYYSDEPSADAGALPVWFLSKLTKQHATVVLTGEGADELFGGYLTYRADVLAARARLVPAALRDLTRRALGAWPVSDDKIGFEYKAKRFLDGCDMSAERAHVYWNGTFSDAEKRRLVPSAPAGALDATLAELRGKLGTSNDPIAPYLWFDQKYFLPDDILVKSDRMSMAHAVEVRPAFLDHRIVEFAATLPANLKMRGARQKVILKELMRDKLPARILTRSKTGFDIPAHQWFRGPLRGLLLDTLAAGAAEHGELFSRAAIDDFVAQHIERRASLGYHLWGLMILFLWMKRWRIQTAPVSALTQQARESVPTSI
jgi:asparagine synthase (glutamine-hydrolysing)